MVSVGQNWRLDCNKSLHSAAELVPGRSIDTVSFCGWAPCHAEAALCEYTSCNMMNILYVWFPASWGPSVVEAIQTRDVTCLAKKPIVRDPHIFDLKEAARGSRAREVTCRIQKWNIKAEGVHPILVANARVDWLAMNDDDITKKFPILLEGSKPFQDWKW